MHRCNSHVCCYGLAQLTQSEQSYMEICICIAMEQLLLAVLEYFLVLSFLCAFPIPSRSQRDHCPCFLKLLSCLYKSGCVYVHVCMSMSFVHVCLSMAAYIYICICLCSSLYLCTVYLQIYASVCMPTC